MNRKKILTNKNEKKKKIFVYALFIWPGVTILLSLTVFLNMVAETMPATSDAVPLLGILILHSTIN